MNGAPGALARLIKLNSNENPFGPSPLALQAMRSVLADSSNYPDDDASALRLKLAQHHGVSDDQILVTGGLTEFLGMLARTFLASGLNAVSSERSFIVYGMATQAAGAQLIEVPMRQHGLDVRAMAAAVNRDTRILFLANPNNPTGTLAGADDIGHLLQHIPEPVVLVLDQAYYEFAAYFAAQRGARYPDSLDYVRAGRNVVVLRTFSKAHGLAGVRVGYGIAPAELMARICRQRSRYCVSTLAQAAAEAACEDQAHIRRAVENNAQQSEQLTHGLSALGYGTVPTWANFLYCQLGQDAREFAERLMREGIAVCPLGPWGAPRAVRITIGRPEQNEALLHALQRLKAS
jgi:histidinol-phosphate aminotransferase